MATRSLISMAECRNGVPVTAQLVRELADWLTVSRDQDLVYSPADPSPFFGGYDTYQYQGNGDLIVGPGHGASSIDAGTFPIPAPLSPATALRLWVCATLDGSGTATVTFRPGAGSGAATVATFTGPGTRVWTSVTVPCTAPDEIAVNIAGGTTGIHLDAICGWWDSPSLLQVPPSWVPMASAPAGDAFSTAALSMLSANADRWTCHHPRPVVAKWFGRWNTSGIGSGWIPVGTYRLWLSPGVGSVTVSVASQAGPHGSPGSSLGVMHSTCILYDAAGGTRGATLGTWDTMLPEAIPWSQHTFTFSAQPYGRLIDLELQVSAGSVNAAWIRSVCAWEEAPSASALGIGSVPSTCPSVAAPTSGDPILRQTLADLSAAQAWIVTHRPRQILTDCRDAFLSMEHTTINGITAEHPGSGFCMRLVRSSGEGRTLSAIVASARRASDMPNGHVVAGPFGALATPGSTLPYLTWVEAPASDTTTASPLSFQTSIADPTTYGRCVVEAGVIVWES